LLDQARSLNAKLDRPELPVEDLEYLTEERLRVYDQLWDTEASSQISRVLEADSLSILLPRVSRVVARVDEVAAGRQTADDCPSELMPYRDVARTAPRPLAARPVCACVAVGLPAMVIVVVIPNWT
jgi:hypothetical protein